MHWRGLEISILFIILLVAIYPVKSILYVSLSNFEGHEKAIEQLHIDNNYEMEKFVEEHNMTGNGSRENPYVISGLHVSNSKYGIYLGNITKYFVLKDISFYNENGEYCDKYGVYLYQVYHGELDNVTVVNSAKHVIVTGIYVENSTKVTINNLQFYTKNEEDGSAVWVYNSTKIRISNISDINAMHGVWVSYSSQISISNFKHISFKGVGAMIGFSDNVTLTNSSLYTHDEGIIICSSVDSNISYNLFIENCDGLWNIWSDNITIEKNSFIYDITGLNMSGINSPVHGNIIRDNLFAYSKYLGIYAFCDGSNWIYGNVFIHSHAVDNGYHKGGLYWNYSYAPESFWNSSIKGNYWDFWAKINDTNDINRDGIIDFPLRIAGSANAEDYYPLKNLPFSFTLPPSSPQNLRIKIENGYVKLIWEKPKYTGTGKIEKYLIYRDGKQIGIVSGEKLEYIDENASLNENSTYYVVAMSSYGMSMISNKVWTGTHSDDTFYFMAEIILIVVVAIFVSFEYFLRKHRKFKS